MNARYGIALAAFLALAPLSDAAWSKTTCKDGTTSNSTGKGTCSKHGGIGDAATAPAAAAPAAAPAAAEPAPAAKATSVSSGSPTAKCKDGTMSYSKTHSGTCSHHKGVAEWLDK